MPLLKLLAQLLFLFTIIIGILCASNSTPKDGLEVQEGIEKVRGIYGHFAKAIKGSNLADERKAAKLDDHKMEKMLQMIGQFSGYKAANKQPKVVFEEMPKKVAMFHAQLDAFLSTMDQLGDLKEGGKHIDDGHEAEMVAKIRIDLNSAVHALKGKLAEFAEHSKVASLIGQPASAFPSMAWQFEHQNEADSLILFANKFGQAEALRQIRRIVEEEKAALEKAIREGVAKENVEGGERGIVKMLPDHFRAYWEMDGAKLLAKELDRGIFESIKSAYLEIETEIGEREAAVKAKKNWTKATKAIAATKALQEIATARAQKRKGAGPVLVPSSLDLKGMEVEGGEASEKMVEEEGKEVEETGKNVAGKSAAQRKAAWPVLVSSSLDLKALELEGGGRGGDGGKMMTKSEIGHSNLETLKKQHKALFLLIKICRKAREAIERVRQRIVEGKLLVKLLEEFRRMEFYFWLNRAAGKLHTLLERMAFAKELDRGKLIGSEKNMAGRMVEAHEMADGIIGGFLRGMNLGDAFEEWLERHLEDGEESDDEEEEEEEKALGMVSEEQKKEEDEWKKKGEEGMGKGKKETEEEEDEERKKENKKVEEEAKMGEEEWKNLKEEEEDAKVEKMVRKWKTHIRLQVLRVLLAYRKMDQTLGISEFAQQQEGEHVPVMKKYKMGLLKSAEDIPNIPKWNELAFALIERMKKVQQNQQKTRAGRN